VNRYDPPLFGGETYEPEFDEGRLRRQLDRVRSLMTDTKWRTLAEIELATGFPQASVSARLRDLRKQKFGGWVVERRRRGEGKRGLFEYRVVVS
jgi:predicted transcriptional regulator